MNDLARILILDSRGTEKLAFDQGLRNFGVDALGGIGTALSGFKHNPMLSSGVLGGGSGAIYGASTADTDYGESRLRKALRYGAGGAVSGAVGGGIMSGAVNNLGQYGEDIADAVKSVRKRGDEALDVEKGGFGKILGHDVFNVEALRGRHTAGARESLKRDKETLKRLKAQMKSTEPSPHWQLDALKSEYEAAEQNIKRSKDFVKNKSGGRGGGLNAIETLGGLGITGIAGGKALDKNQESKHANFGALAGRAVGHGLQGAAVAMRNPGYAGAALGAGVGALTAGEGNRLQGALGGAALGTGAGVGLAKMAPASMQNIRNFAGKVKTEGKKVIDASKKDNATFGSTLGAMKPGTDVAGRTGSKWTSDTWQRATANRPVGETAGQGMGALAALGTGVAATGAAGVLGGAAMQRPTQNNQK